MAGLAREGGLGNVGFQERVEAVCSSRRPDIIVHEIAELAAPFAGALTRIPVATVGYVSTRLALN